MLQLVQVSLLLLQALEHQYNFAKTLVLLAVLLLLQVPVVSQFISHQLANAGSRLKLH